MVSVPEEMHSHPGLLYHVVPFRSFFSSRVLFFTQIRIYLRTISLVIVLLFQVILSGQNLPPYLWRQSSSSFSSLARSGSVRFRGMGCEILTGKPLPDNSPLSLLSCHMFLQRLQCCVPRIVNTFSLAQNGQRICGVILFPDLFLRGRNGDGRQS